MSALAPGQAERRSMGKKAMATKAAIIDLAAQMFSERGYVQTSIRDVAKRAGLTTGAIYGSFRNKADLLAEAISTRTAEELEAQSIGLNDELDYIETLTRLTSEFPRRRLLRSLLVQGAAAAHTDEATRQRLRDEQLVHVQAWRDAYERERERMGIHPSVNLEVVVLYTWAVELGLGVLEGLGIDPGSPDAWAQIQNRLARSLQLPPDDVTRPRPRRRSKAAAT